MAGPLVRGAERRFVPDLASVACRVPMGAGRDPDTRGLVAPAPSAWSAWSGRRQGCRCAGRGRTHLAQALPGSPGPDPRAVMSITTARTIHLADQALAVVANETLPAGGQSPLSTHQVADRIG